jgi:hypothetical protein
MPEQLARWTLENHGDPARLDPDARAVYDQLVADDPNYQRAAARARAGRFPSSLQTRRGILEGIARRNEKYARPFDGGRMASVSLIGTESWSDYGAVVLQMAILDTLLSIEEKLGALTPPETETHRG